MIDLLATLQRMESRVSKRSGEIIVRSLSVGEPLPALPHGLPDLPCIQREWIWVAGKVDEEPMAMLVAAPVHNLAFLSRLVTGDCATAAVLVPLFRKALADMHLRGYTGYVVCLGDNPTEQRLARIAKKAGATVIDPHCTMLTGPTENKIIQCRSRS